VRARRSRAIMPAVASSSLSLPAGDNRTTWTLTASGSSHLGPGGATERPAVGHLAKRRRREWRVCGSQRCELATRRDLSQNATAFATPCSAMAS
jgi:hypothetical protein